MVAKPERRRLPSAESCQESNRQVAARDDGRRACASTRRFQTPHRARRWGWVGPWTAIVSREQTQMSNQNRGHASASRVWLPTDYAAVSSIRRASNPSITAHKSLAELSPAATAFSAVLGLAFTRF